MVSFLDRPNVFIWPHFKPTDENLFMMESVDGESWSARVCTYTPNGSDGVRDPCMIRHGDKLWLVHTAVPVTSYFDLAMSTDGHAFTYQRQVDLSSIVSGAGRRVWAPHFLTPDNSGDGKYYWVVSCSNNGNGGPFQAYYAEITNLTDFSTNGAWTAITGSNLPANMIDAEIVRIGSTWHMIYKDDDTNFLCIATSTTSAFAGYTVVKTGDWAGWGGGMEGPDLLPLLNGTWRCYMDNTGSGYFYSDSNTSDPLGSWGARAEITAPYTPQHGRISLFGYRRVSLNCTAA